MTFGLGFLSFFRNDARCVFCYAHPLSLSGE